MKYNIKRFVLLIAPLLLWNVSFPKMALSQSLSYSDQIWNFGHIGIDFKVYHAFWIANNGAYPVKINDIVVTCECSKVRASDTVIAPGDTVYFRLTFDTKNYYGAVNRSFTVELDSKEIPELQFHHLATVGQWFYGVKPDPISIFILPAHKSHLVTVTNTSFDEIKTRIVEQADDWFATTIKTESARKGKAVEIEISPTDKIGAGTFKSSVTIAIETGQSDKPALLTIPVKIVRY